jgi:hypothetical protein
MISRPSRLASVLFIATAASALSAEPVDRDQQAKEDAKQDFTTIFFDGLKTWPYRRVLVPESCDKGGRLNYPDGFISEDGQFLSFAFDDNRHRCVFYQAKLPAMP